jgi:CRP-like cAMP-binding protein
MADAALVSFLSRTPFFGGLTEQALERVVSKLASRELAPGTAVFREGDQGNSLFIVQSGELVVWHRGPEGDQPVKLTRLSPGDFFGEMTLIEMQPRSATVVAETAAVVLELRGRDLYELYKEDIKAYVMVLQNVNRELCRRLRRTNERLVEWAASAHDETTQLGMHRTR